ncbi:thioredoxin family protein [Proteiniphilum sp. UBA5384]|uniref:thioredoxin family protein n=1 Tax=Proteiniphilum sp. UBA5384 TaxID=1947279 RepID=UPI0025F633CA|nr:thioredoxin domain-containing protein [Proteiniphilum sp. UBA5384]
MRKFILLFVALMMIVSVFASEPKEKKAAKLVELTKATFLEKVFDYESNPEVWSYKGDKPAIVDFYADWCGPCRIVSPVLKDLAVEYGDEIYIYKINIDKEKELAGVFGARSIPMFLFIPMDRDPQIGMGALPKKSFREVIDTFLLKKENLQKTE